jgi:hypothetical protein
LQAGARALSARGVLSPEVIMQHTYQELAAEIGRRIAADLKAALDKNPTPDEMFGPDGRALNFPVPPIECAWSPYVLCWGEGERVPYRGRSVAQRMFKHWGPLSEHTTSYEVI